MPIPTGELAHRVNIIPFAEAQTADLDLATYDNAAGAMNNVSCLLLTDKETEALTVLGNFQQTYLKMIVLPTQAIEYLDKVVIAAAHGPYPVNSIWTVSRGPVTYQDFTPADFMKDVILQKVQ